MHITPVLAGLMESNIAHRMAFETFFDVVKNITDMATVRIFDCGTGLNNKFYVNRSDRYAKFQELIASNTEIPAGEQLILFHNKELSELVESTIEIQNWPKKILRGQFFLYQRERLDQQRLVLPEIRKFISFNINYWDWWSI